MGKISSALDWCKDHGVSRRSLTIWRDQDGFPLIASGRGREATVDCAAAWAWCMGRGDRAIESARHGYENERERLAAEQADNIAMKNAAARAKIVTMDDLLAVLLPSMVALKSQLLGSSATLAADIFGKFPGVDQGEARQMIWSNSRDLLENAAREIGTLGERIADCLGNLADADPAAESHSD